MGAVGLPVFSYSQGGLHVLIGPTGGYLWGFIPGCYILGALTEKRISYGTAIPGMLLCAAVYFAVGTVYLAFLLHLNLYQALLMGVIPYIPFDLLKIFIAASLSITLRRRLDVMANIV